MAGLIPFLLAIIFSGGTHGITTVTYAPTEELLLPCLTGASSDAPYDNTIWRLGDFETIVFDPSDHKCGINKTYRNTVKVVGSEAGGEASLLWARPGVHDGALVTCGSFQGQFEAFELSKETETAATITIFTEENVPVIVATKAPKHIPYLTAVPVEAASWVTFDPNGGVTIRATLNFESGTMRTTPGFEFTNPSALRERDMTVAIAVREFMHSAADVLTLRVFYNMETGFPKGSALDNWMVQIADSFDTYATLGQTFALPCSWDSDPHAFVVWTNSDGVIGTNDPSMPTLPQYKARSTVRTYRNKTTLYLSNATPDDAKPYVCVSVAGVLAPVHQFSSIDEMGVIVIPRHTKTVEVVEGDDLLLSVPLKLGNGHLKVNVTVEEDGSLDGVLQRMPNGRYEYVAAYAPKLTDLPSVYPVPPPRWEPPSKEGHRFVCTNETSRKCFWEKVKTAAEEEEEADNNDFFGVPIVYTADKDIETVSVFLSSPGEYETGNVWQFKIINESATGPQVADYAVLVKVRRARPEGGLPGDRLLLTRVEIDNPLVEECRTRCPAGDQGCAHECITLAAADDDECDDDDYVCEACQRFCAEDDRECMRDCKTRRDEISDECPEDDTLCVLCQRHCDDDDVVCRQECVDDTAEDGECTPDEECEEDDLACELCQQSCLEEDHECLRECVEVAEREEEEVCPTGDKVCGACQTTCANADHDCLERCVEFSTDDTYGESKVWYMDQTGKSVSRMERVAMCAEWFEIIKARRITVPPRYFSHVHNCEAAFLVLYDEVRDYFQAHGMGASADLSHKKLINPPAAPEFEWPDREPRYDASVGSRPVISHEEQRPGFNPAIVITGLGCAVAVVAVLGVLLSYRRRRAKAPKLSSQQEILLGATHEHPTIYKIADKIADV